MPSWILIPIYLLRNSLHRWWENLASPATKVLVPFLLATLALLVLGFFKTIEESLSEQLLRDDLRAIQLSEGFYGQDGPRGLQAIRLDRELWEPYAETYDVFQRIPISAETRWMRQTPVIVYDEELSFVDLPETPLNEAREVVVLSSEEIRNQFETISFRGATISAAVQPMPPLIESVFGGKALIFVPAEMVDAALAEGFVQMQRIVPKQGISPATLEKKIRTFANLEDRQIQVISSVSVLEQLQLLLRGQQAARWALGGVLTLILSLILASLSLLEFRQEAYLIALLRSFGVRAGVLLAHVFLESCVLTFAGVYLAVLVVERFFPLIMSEVGGLAGGLGLQVPEVSMASAADMQLLFGATMAGVMLATIPVLFGLRKRPGLVLS